MKMSKGSLCELLATTFNLEADSEEFYSLFAHTISYITQGIGPKEYHKRIKHLCVEEGLTPMRFRLRLHRSEYTSLVLKLYVLRLGKLRSFTSDAAKEICKEYGIYACDGRRVFRLWLDHGALRKRMKIMGKSLDVETRLNLNNLRALLNSSLEAIAKYIKFYTYRKLRFIYEANGLDPTDFHSELRIAAVDRFYRKMPMLSTQKYVVNYLRRSVKSRALNIIEASTSGRRGRLVSNKRKDGTYGPATLLEVTESQLPLSSSGDTMTLADLAACDPMQQFEVEHSVRAVVSSVAPGGKKYRILQVLMGAEDPGFTEWLHENKYATREETNIDVQVRTNANDFNRKLGRYLRISSTKLDAFIDTLRVSLAPCTDRGSYPTAA